MLLCKRGEREGKRRKGGGRKKETEKERRRKGLEKEERGRRDCALEYMKEKVCG